MSLNENTKEVSVASDIENISLIDEISSSHDKASFSFNSLPAENISTPSINIASDIIVESDTKENSKYPQIELKDYLKFISKPYVDLNGNEVNLYISFSIPEEYLKDTSFFVRFGSYDDIPENWEDIKIKPSDISKNDQGNYTIHTKWVIAYKGNFGATVYASYPTSTNPVWQGTKNDDAKFRIDNDCFFTIEKIIKKRENFKKDAKEILLKDGMKNLSSFKNVMNDLLDNPNSKYLAETLYEATRQDPSLRDKISIFYEDIMKEYQTSSKYSSMNIAKNIAEQLNHIGIREVVLVSPEGPHATNGGLAQVMNGLLKAFSNKKISVTLISTIYEYDQGSKHPCADYLLKTGIKLGNYILKPKYSGEVAIPFGRISAINGGGTIQNAFHARATVHIAKHDNMKLVLLRSKRFADYLYAMINPDEQLRRAIFLSRGALEVINNPIFDVHPQVIISNDWMAGLIPAFLKLDNRYASSLAFKDCKTIHMIHNCGRDYHGNFPINYNGQNLYDMLELDSAHIPGLTHPHNKAMLNLTASALFHLNGAFLAVSKSYASELLDYQKGEGLTDLIRSRKGAIFGISNGIDQISIRRRVIELGTLQGEDEISPEDDKSYFAKISTFKARIKEKLQRDLGLDVNPNAKIFSFVGRFAEQKGLELMYNRPNGRNESVIESILYQYPESQFVFAGPVTDGDTHARNFKNCIEYLCSKFPNRVKAICNFVSHDYSIEITSGSDFTLMPSRFEPCGLVQLEAVACGTVVVARNVGGLSVTLHPYGDFSDESNAFMFDDYTSTALYNTICYALNTTKDENLMKALQYQAAKARHDWNHRVENYIALFQYITGVMSDYEHYQFLDAKKEMIANHCAN